MAEFGGCQGRRVNIVSDFVLHDLKDNHDVRSPEEIIATAAILCQIYD